MSPGGVTPPPAGRTVDPDDRRLLDEVRPPGWTNPAPAPRYHLVVIGGGTGGLVSAAAAAQLGARVALVEERRLGGDCLNFGCVPSKALIRAARAWHEARRAAAEFGGPPAAGEGDFAAAMQRMRRLRARIAPADSAHRFRRLGVDVFFGHARFVAADAVRVEDASRAEPEAEGATLRFRRAIVATGSRPAVPPIEGLREAGYLTSDTVFDLREPPGGLLLIGGGAIGCELAQAFGRLGVRVTVLEREGRLLPGEEPEASRRIEDALRADGVEVRTGVEVRGVTRAGERVTVSATVPGGGTERFEAERVLVAVGRAPNVEALGLEAAGIEPGPHGVRVDDRLRTTNRRVYAVGDVCGPDRFTHVADAHARIALRNALFFGRQKTRDLVLPRVTYTSPEVARVGPTEAEAAEAGIDVEAIAVPLSEVDRAVLEGAEEGTLRLLLRHGGDRLVGATLVAEGAGEMIGEVALAMTRGLPLSAIGETVHPYPTQAEVFRRAADLRRRQQLTPLVRRGFALFFRLFR